MVGAGAAGLASARELLREGHKVTVFELGSCIGGTWVYTEEVESDDLIGIKPDRQRLHSSMYKGLRTNLPREIMGFLEFPFDTHYPGKSVDPRRYCTHEEVLAYLDAFANYFNLKKWIRFNTKVIKVAPIIENGSERESQTNGHGTTVCNNNWPRWQVASITTLPNGEESTTLEIYDAVVLCNGHFSEPRVPVYEGQDIFPGLQLHSHNYRKPEDYIGKSVVVVGAANSGVDIAQELYEGGAAAVYLSARSWGDAKTGEAPSGIDPTGMLVDTSSNGSVVAPPSIGGEIVRVHNIESMGADGSVTFVGGFKLDKVDAIIYGTGYLYTFPFLEGTVAAPTIDDNRVGPLYKHIFPPHWAPTLSFIGLTFKVVPFPQFELQSKWVAKCLSGAVTLPSPAEMEDEVDEYYAWMEKEGLPKRHTFMNSMDSNTAYNRWLSNVAGNGDDGWPEWRRNLYAASALRKANGLTYRDLPLEKTAGEAIEHAKAEAVAIRAAAKAQVVA